VDHVIAVSLGSPLVRSAMSLVLAFACRRPVPPAVLRRLVVLCLASAMLSTVLLPSGPAVAQPTKPAKRAEIDGTPQLKWQPANVTIAPGGTVTFKIVGATPHPVGSGSAPPNDDGKFDTSGCQADKLSGDGASCTVRLNKAGTYPYFCTLHFAAGMVGSITVGSGSGSAAPGIATVTTSAGAAPLVTSPRAGTPPAPGKPAIYWAGYGLLALGALIALVTVFAYVRFLPRFRRPWR
jgi:plastocyanin